MFVRNENYWEHPKPYVDSVTIIDLTDDSARVNALVSGAVDAIDSVPYALLPSVQANPNLHALVSQTGNWYPLTMRVDQPPFNDPRVRQAMRLLIDRNQMLSDAYGGHARMGNDLFAIDDPLYDHSIPQRQQDIEQAKSLLKQAGHGDGLTVNLVTAPIENGVVQSSVVFAQQAKAAGVNVNLTKLDTTTFYNNQYMQRTFSVDWWDAESFLSGTAYTQLPTLPLQRDALQQPAAHEVVPASRIDDQLRHAEGDRRQDAAAAVAKRRRDHRRVRRQHRCLQQQGHRLHSKQDRLQPELLGRQECVVRLS